jgi:hypothetical protein
MRRLLSESWQKRLALPHALILLLAVAAAAWLAHSAWFKLPRRWDAGYVQAAQTQGKALLTALETYRAQHGDWPDTLSRLAGPIPPPDLGMREWIYAPRSDSFTLRVNGSPSGYPSLQYNAKTKQWELDV